MRSLHYIQNYLEPKGYLFIKRFLGIRQFEFVSIRSPKGNGITVGAESPLLPFQTASVRLICKNKQLAYDFMRSENINVPQTFHVTAVSEIGDEIESLLARGTQLIVKPHNGSGSSGLTLGVTTLDALKKGVAVALQNSDVALIQPQFVGEEIRMTIINGKVRSAMLRQKPHVIGNGTASIKSLIEAENTARASLDNTAVQYPALTEAIIDGAFLTDERVPAAGERIELGRGTMIRTGASMYEVLDNIHPSYIQLIEAAVKDLGKGLVAVDIMAADYTQPPQENNYIFLEFNLNPALVLYYSCRDGRHFKIVEEYLGPMIEALLAERGDNE